MQRVAQVRSVRLLTQAVRLVIGGGVIDAAAISCMQSKTASLASNAGMSAEKSIVENRQRADVSLSASGDPVIHGPKPMMHAVQDVITCTSCWGLHKADPQDLRQARLPTSAEVETVGCGGLQDQCTASKGYKNDLQNARHVAQ